MSQEEKRDAAAGPAKFFERFLRRAPKQSRSRAVVDAVITAFEEQLQRGEDPDEPSIARLLERAGVGIGSFYEYFASRDSLLGVLIGKVTERNFENLLAGVDRENATSLDRLVASTSLAVARTYLERPRVMHAVIMGVARLGLHPLVVRERDRFCEELSRRVLPFMPGVERSEIARALCVAGDAAMGVVLGELERAERPDIEACARTIERMTWSLFDGLIGRPGARQS